MKKLSLKSFLTTCLMLFVWVPVWAWSEIESVDFNRLTNRNGLSNSQVNAILKDSRGYVWMGTQSGLNRFDGFRMKVFLYDDGNPHSIPNNMVDQIMEAANGDLWMRTSVGYCVYRYDLEQFDRHPAKWLKSVGVNGEPYKMLIDSKKNMWFVVHGQGIYFLDTKTMKTFLFRFSKKPIKNTLPSGSQVNSICDQNGQAVVMYEDGAIYRLDGYAHKIVWKDNFLQKNKLSAEKTVCAFVDNKNNYWVSGNAGSYVYSASQHKWYVGINSFLASLGIKSSMGIHRVIIRDLVFDKKGNLWIATDHKGLYCLDYSKRVFRQFVNLPSDKGSISDNSLQSLYVDNSGSLWVGTYKNGVCYYSSQSTKFNTIPLGDICTITQDLQGNFWCGTNDSGIVEYNPVTGQTKRFYSTDTGLGSEVVVSSVTMKDGTMYFGTYNGGLARYANGVWKVYRKSPGGLAYNSVWSLAESPDHRLLIATLGGGFQIFDPATETFKTFNISNSRLKSNFVSSLFMQGNHQLLIGHSQYMSIFDFRTQQMMDLNKTPDGHSFLSPSINYAMMDSRGLLWLATPAGIAMYDMKSGQVGNINILNGTPGAVGCSIIEDHQHLMWLVTEYMVTRVKLTRAEDGRWNLDMTNYNSLDGLQDRQFNYRSAYLLKNGNLAIGGQDGINIISPQRTRTVKTHVRALFSGLVLFDHALMAGEEYEGRVVLGKSLDASHRLDLNCKSNTFTIQLASSDVTLPARCRFLYRMKGASDKWILTQEGHPEVTFTNLSSGSYTLQVKVVNGDGTVNDEVSELKINVAPPFYLSVWAILVYVLLAVGAFMLYRRRIFEQQRIKYERQRMEENIKKTKELNELKLNFFTNVSHELRTPLTLIISPLTSMMKNEEDEAKRRKLELVHRNAVRLLNLVNQLLDFRKFDQSKEKLSLSHTEMVSFVDNICASFRILANNKVNLDFKSDFPSYSMEVDADKVGKIINNLLSNAYKFTPDGGKITVSLSLKEKAECQNGQINAFCITVADTGKGISDDDKKRIFDRFYQVAGTEKQPTGGSGIGLNLVKKFVELHGGKVSVEDNPGGGTIFVVELPISVAETSPDVKAVSTEGNDAKSVRKPTLLLVDDSDDFREFMRDLLTDYQVVEAVNGQDAWNKINFHRPDIILSDVMMPVMDGNELCRKVKASEDFASIPFVLLTARLADEHRKEGLMSGADEYITKPFDIDMLHLRLQNLLNWAKRSEVNAGSSLKNRNSKETSADANPANEETFMMSDADRKLIDKVDQYIRENMGDPDTSVESMSAHLCISRVQLYKRMISLTGITPSEYLRAKRIKRAEELMHEGNLNVSEIAYKVGFNNPRYFSKYFQEEYGITPSQYMKNLR